jgi:uncharacterized protein (TIGR02246 family)
MQARQRATASTPEQLHLRFTEAFNAGDLDGLVALYEPDAVLAPEPGKTVAGRDAITEAYRAFLNMNPRMDVKTLGVLQMAEGLALAHGRWSMTGTCEGGPAVHMTGHNTEVMRRQPDSSWLFVIDNPFAPE